MEAKQKILVCGDVKGNFKTLFNKLDNINSKSGPFEFLLCVGDFFGSDNGKLEAYKNGNLKIAVPTYILGPSRPEHVSFYENLEDGEICTNLTYLGRRGLYTVSSGVKIAYVTGVEATNASEKNEWTFNEADINAVITSCLASNASTGDYRGIDILITSQWPKGPRDNEANTSKLLSWLSAEIKPRYHFCGLNDGYFEPAPYRNAARVNSQLELATRFIALACVGNAAKSKWIYALNLTPVDKMRLTDLLQKTTNEVPCPYDAMALSKRDGRALDGGNRDGGNQFFYDMNASQHDNRRRNNRRGGFGYDDKPKRPRQQEIDLEKCWFCLSSPTVEKHLVISIGEKFYLALSKGPINEYHGLILPVTHVQSASLFTEEYWEELNRFKGVLKEFFASKDQVVAFYERNYKTNHLQINVIAVDKSIEWKIRHAFQDKADEYNLPFDTLATLQAEDLPERGPYFVAELPDGAAMLCKQMKQFPLHFGREVFCSAELLDCEEKADWRQCELTKDTEVEYVTKFRNEFAPFDFTV